MNVVKCLFCAEIIKNLGIYSNIFQNIKILKPKIYPRNRSLFFFYIPEVISDFTDITKSLPHPP